MTWHKGSMVGYDCETTGVDVETDRIVTAAVILRHPAEKKERWTWLANPGVPIPEQASKIHGVTDARAAADGQPPFEVIDQVATHLSAALALDIPIVCANAPFDLTILDRECHRWMLPTLEQRAERVSPVVDVQVLDKYCDQYRKGRRTLTALCTQYKVELGDAHNAAADAEAALEVALRLAAMYPMLQTVTAEQLHQWQTQWRIEQQNSLAQYFRRTGKTRDAETISTAWPFIPYSQPKQEPMW